MFDYEEYVKEYDKIIEEESDNFNFDEEQSVGVDEKYSNMKNELNRKYKIIFKHSLSDAWHLPIREFYILDDNDNNIYIYDNENDEESRFTISYENIKKIKMIMNDINGLFSKEETLSPPILDGTIHDIYYANENNFAEVKCFNLWFWLDENNFKMEDAEDMTERVRCTKDLITFIKELQLILSDNDIEYMILCDD